MAGRTVAGYANKLSGWRRDAVKRVVALVDKAAPGAVSSIKWSQPVFELDGPFCYVRAFPKHVNFGFWRGAELPDPKRRLKGTGGKMRHIRLTSLDDIDERAFRALVKAAAALNQRLGNPTKPTKKAPKKRAAKKVTKKAPKKRVAKKTTKKVTKKRAAKKATNRVTKKKPVKKATKKVPAKRATKTRRRS
ncbi:MAG: DUF1801 domain-containing protein [Deltaproteobacteria bacterium]|nr:DUF1801 domain-containing protein [Deltaproteobacteria bacterium]